MCSYYSDAWYIILLSSQQNKVSWIANSILCCCFFFIKNKKSMALVGKWLQCVYIVRIKKCIYIICFNISQLCLLQAQLLKLKISRFLCKDFKYLGIFPYFLCHIYIFVGGLKTSFVQRRKKNGKWSFKIFLWIYWMKCVQSTIRYNGWLMHHG